MNFELPYVPERPAKDRESGVTMVMDKGLSVRQAEDLMDAAGEYIDLVKLGFGTSLITGRLKDKIKVYQSAGVRVYAGGTCFEAFALRGMVDDYLRYVESLGLDTAEVSDGTMEMKHDDKCAYIERLAKHYRVLSEVGSKLEGRIIPDDEWVKMMQRELDCGSWKVIAEARESGTIGIYDKNGKANTGLIDAIKKNIDGNKILWEAPKKAQQCWFIKNFGANVNLGNIDPNEAIALEALRVGLRGDTLFHFIPKK